MKILYVYDGEWPKGATRVVKQTRSLAKAGHEVHLLARNEARLPRAERNEWMQVHRLPAVGPRLVNRVANFPYFFNPVWVWSIGALVRSTGADCIVVADLPLAPTCVAVGGALGVPVHYDMAEVYPEFLRGLWEFGAMGMSDHLVRNPRLAELLERAVLPEMATVFVVSEESRQRCLALGVPDERVVIVGNTPEEIPDLEAHEPVPADLAPFTGRPIALFVGILIGDRGVDRAVEAMATVRATHPDALLVVVGDGTDRDRLEALTDRLQLREHVHFSGWQSHDRLSSYYRQSRIGLLPFLDGSHVQITLANKLFDYMAHGLPVIASDLRPMRRIVTGHGTGLMVTPGDAGELASAITRLLDDETTRREMGARGRACVVEHYNWARDEKRLVSRFLVPRPTAAE